MQLLQISDMDVSVTSWPLSTCLDGRIALSGRTLPCVA